MNTRLQMVLLVLGALLGACGFSDTDRAAQMIAFDALVSNSHKHTGQYLCTEGVHVDGFEASGLAASTYEKDGHPQLAEPVIWLEGADFRSREDCTRTDTQPSFEFCRAVVCGIFETGGGYGHGGAYAYQLRGQDVSALPGPTVPSAPVPTTPSADRETSEREPDRDSSQVQPPPAMLEIAGEEQVSGIGSYGFLVEVQAPPPTLVVDEYPIVAAEVDGPGHFEYTDRLGEQVLTRIEGLRARAVDQKLVRSNAALAPFGYRLEARFVAEWDRTFYDLYREGQAEPMLAGLSHFWPVSVNASGTDFVLAAENAPNLSPLYLLVQAGSVVPWDAGENAYLPPAYVDDALACVTFTGFPTLTYQVELDGQAVYSGTAVALGAYMPLRSFTTWDSHWVLEVDDHLIMDGQDLGENMGYDAVFGFSLIQGEPFYFFEEEGKIRMSYGGRSLPNVYDQVFHNQCCEAAIHNIETLGDAVLFHALWDGTWYLVEAGVYDGEMASTYRYTAPEGWSFRYPAHWDRLNGELGFVQETVTGKMVTFASQLTNQVELERWLESEIARKLGASEGDNSLAEPLTTGQEGALTVYRYAILSRLEASETLLRTTVFFDGQRRYEFYAAVPPVAEEEYGAIVTSFQPAGR